LNSDEINSHNNNNFGWNIGANYLEYFIFEEALNRALNYTYSVNHNTSLFWFKLCLYMWVYVSFIYV
jgi:hypothetical protein